jgi:hypothetical protein
MVTVVVLSGTEKERAIKGESIIPLRVHMATFLQAARCFVWVAPGYVYLPKTARNQFFL